MVQNLQPRFGSRQMQVTADNTPPDTTLFTLYTFRLDETPSDNKDRDRCLYSIYIATNLYMKWLSLVLVSKHCRSILCSLEL
jgi:hypothetical protein